MNFCPACGLDLRIEEEHYRRWPKHAEGGRWTWNPSPDSWTGHDNVIWGDDEMLYKITVT